MIAMSDPQGVAPDWSDIKIGGFVVSASAAVELGQPLSDPEVAGITLYLEIRENEDIDEDGDAKDDGHYSPSFIWRFGISEEDAGFGEAELDNGESPEMNQAKLACWTAVIEYLRADGYSDGEITDAI